MKWIHIRVFGDTTICISIITVLFLGLTYSTDLQDLPDENDNFEDIRIKNKVYVDKSAYIPKLLNLKSNIVRMCRPPNFGKSTFLQMLNLFFRGKRELFKGLNIDSNSDWHSHPVIYLDFNVMNVTFVTCLEEDLRRAITQIGKSYDIHINELYEAKSQLDQLIDALSKRGEVIILLNDYDRPARERGESGDFVESKEMECHLHHFLSSFKYDNPKVRLLFMTCTMPMDLNLNFSAVNKNLLVDITFDAEFNGMIGLKEEELIDNFEPHIQAMTERRANESFESAVRLLKQRYNGYCLSNNTRQSCRLFGFSSVFACLHDRVELKDGSPSFKAMERFTGRGYYHTKPVKGYRRLVLNFFKNLTVSWDSLHRMPDFERSDTSHEFECPDVESAIIIMILYGYLTFSSYNKATDEVSVDFPNKRMREKFIQDLLNSAPAAKMPAEKVLEKCQKIRESLFDGDSEEFFDFISEMIFNPEENVTRDGEYVYTDRLVRVLQTCDIKSSFQSSRLYEHRDENKYHDIDLIVAGPSIGMWNDRLSVKFQSVFEFQWLRTADHAMDKLLKFLKSDRFHNFYWDSPIQAIAINFNNQNKGINDWIRVSYHGKDNFTHLRTSFPQYIAKYQHLYLDQNEY